jgi:hypothetical protein
MLFGVTVILYFLEWFFPIIIVIELEKFSERTLVRGPQEVIIFMILKLKSCINELIRWVIF